MYILIYKEQRVLYYEENSFCMHRQHLPKPYGGGAYEQNACRKQNY
jgi:hypothetical protein